MVRRENPESSEELKEKFIELHEQYDSLTKVIENFQSSLLLEESNKNFESLNDVFSNLKVKLNQAEGKLYHSFNRIISLNEAINSIQLLFINGKKDASLFKKIIKKIVEVTGAQNGLLEIVVPTLPVGPSKKNGEGKREQFIYPEEDLMLSIPSFYQNQAEDNSNKYNIHHLVDGENKGVSLLTYFLISQQQLIGLIRLSYRNERITHDLVKLYEPLFQSCVSIIEAINVIKAKELSEVRLQEKENLFSEAQKIANLGWWEHNLITNQIWWSYQVYQIFGIDQDPDFLTPEYFFSRVHPEDKDDVASTTKEAIDQKKEYQIEHRIIRPDGQIRFVKENAKLICDSKGQPLKLIGTVLDITQSRLNEEKINLLALNTQMINEELQASEEELRQTLDTSVALNEKLLESETRLKEAQEIARLARWEFLAGNKTFIWSKEMYQLYGENGEKAIQGKQDPLAIIHPQDRIKLMEQGRMAILQRKDFEFDIRINRKDGKTAWVVGKGKPVMNDSGKLLKYVGIAMDISERKNAEISIKRSEELFKALIQNSSDFVHLTNDQGEITYESPAVEKILGYLPGEILGKNIFELTHPQDTSNSRKIFEALKLTPGKSAIFQVRLKDKSGKWIWMETLATNLLNDTSVNAFVFNNRDITERKLAQNQIDRLLHETQIINLELRSSEEEIRQTLQHSIELNQKLSESQEQLKEAQEIAKLGRWEYDFYEDKIYWSEEVYKIFGLYDCSLPVHTDLFLDKIYPEYRDKVMGIIEEASEYGKGFKQEVKIKSAHGDRWIYMIGKPSLNEEGAVIKLVIVVLDITERKQAEIALNKSEKLFRQLIENSQDGIFLLDARSRIIYASPSSSKILGYNIHEMLDHPEGLDFVHPEYQAYVNQQYSELFLKPGSVLTLIYLAKHKDGSWKWIENIAKNLINDPDINAIVINARDITSSKQAQIALEERERRFRKLIENSHDGIAISDENDEIFYVSDSVQKILGYELNEVLEKGKTPSLVHPDDLQEFKKARKELSSKINHCQVQIFRLKHKNNTYRWIHSVSTNLLNDPDVKGIVSNFRDITERRLAEMALTESERRYRMLMEEASDGIFLSNSSGQYISVNNRGCQMLGYNQEELLKLTVQEVISMEGQDKQPFTFDELHSGTSILTERYMKRKNGTFFPVEISAKKLDENTYQAFVRDITERRKSEEIIKKSEGELNALFHALPDLIIVFNKAGEFLRISSNIPDLHYPPGEDLIGKNIFDVLPTEEASLINEYIQKAFEASDLVQTEYNIDYNGRKVWLTVTVSPMPDDKVVWVARDTTHRKHAEEELINSKYYLDKIINTIPEPVFVKDQHHQWILLNDALCEYLGHSREELLGKTDYDFFDPEKAKNFWEKDEVVMQTGEDNLMEEELVDHNGVKHTLIIKKSLYHDLRRGKLLVGIINDITDRKRIEKKLQNQNEELTKINAELDKFVYRASHDLRAPLVSILGLINIAKMENNLEKNIHYFGLMEKSINKLDNFIQSIIHYSRNSRLEVNIEQIDIDLLVEETFDDLKYIEASKKIALKVNVEGENLFYSDLFRLKIIFNNMISNAIRYSNPRRENPFLNINIQVSPDVAVIKFEDNGIGIAEESVPRIFEMFYRASELNVGSGLGLYIVKDVVDTMKGNIQVESKLGEGTIFTITIPNTPPEK